MLPRLGVHGAAAAANHSMTSPGNAWCCADTSGGRTGSWENCRDAPYGLVLSKGIVKQPLQRPADSSICFLAGLCRTVLRSQCGPLSCRVGSLLSGTAKGQCRSGGMCGHSHSVCEPEAGAKEPTLLVHNMVTFTERVWVEFQGSNPQTRGSYCHHLWEVVVIAFFVQVDPPLARSIAEIGWGIFGR